MLSLPGIGALSSRSVRLQAVCSIFLFLLLAPWSGDTRNEAALNSWFVKRVYVEPILSVIGQHSLAIIQHPVLPTDLLLLVRKLVSSPSIRRLQRPGVKIRVKMYYFIALVIIGHLSLHWIIGLWPRYYGSSVYVSYCSAVFYLTFCFVLIRCRKH
jgi:hypothetical protein